MQSFDSDRENADARRIGFAGDDAPRDWRDMLGKAVVALGIVPSALILIAIAIILAIALSHLVWSFLYSDPPPELGTVAFITALLVATPMLGSLVAAIIALERGKNKIWCLVRELALTRDTAEEASRAKSAFLANMSHELRTPLNAIIGFSEIMKSEVYGPLGDKKYAGYAHDICASGQHLLNIINEILDLSKIEAGRMTLEEEPVDILTAVRDALQVVSVEAQKKQVALLTDIPPDLPMLKASGRLLHQMLLNLLSNAVKFTPAGGQVVVKAQLDPEERLELAVTDTGIGMNRSDIRVALTPFGQVEHSLVRKQSGTGLGLPIAKSLIELHGGSLDIASARGKGTNVILRFPHERILPKQAAPPTPIQSFQAASR
jgi:signal transduction histidine kinase